MTGALTLADPTEGCWIAELTVLATPCGALPGAEQLDRSSPPTATT